jgi:hypothetical protein
MQLVFLLIRGACSADTAQLSRCSCSSNNGVCLHWQSAALHDVAQPDGGLAASLSLSITSHPWHMPSCTVQAPFAAVFVVVQPPCVVAMQHCWQNSNAWGSICLRVCIKVQVALHGLHCPGGYCGADCIQLVNQEESG